jgi:DNA invertase Pin-like site-specific DNA recombinase
MKTVAIYARVSTKDKGQDTDNQLFQLREYCARQTWNVLEEYVDHESAKTGDRGAFKRLFGDASCRKFDIVLVWALDRFTREGVLETFTYIEKLREFGVSFESYTEAHFRTTGPAGELMLAVAAWIAKQERLRISERTKAGIDRARREGKHCGRPRRVFRRDEVTRLRDVEQLSWSAIADRLGVPVSTAVDAYRSAERGGRKSPGTAVKTNSKGESEIAHG